VGRVAALVLGAAAIAAAVYWARTHPAACPYSLRVLLGPRPFIGRERLLEVLEPAPGERILEIGPGTGYYTLDVAARLAGGSLAVFDVQQEMLDHVMREAGARGISNVEPKLGDARALPYPDAGFDAAYLVTVLGEVPDQAAALRELHRVLKPGGRLVVGELALGDPHFVAPGSLSAAADPVGFKVEQRVGPPFGYFALLRRR
jgi:ubiquinone/menaquinone biosynthesis C-methylase UbiE